VNSKVERNDLSEKVAIVTGGAGLLGTDYCLTLSAAGAKVCIADVEFEAASTLAAKITETTGTSVIPHQTDVSDAASVRTCVKATMEEFGRVDILVNNAAINPKFDRDHANAHLDTFETFPLKAWQESLDVNVTGMFLCAQAVSEPMLNAGGGVMVNISSTYGMVGPDQRLYQRDGIPPTYKPVTYTVSKAAAHGLTRYLATYFAGKGIRVNTLTPGGVFADHDEEFVRRYSEKTVLGRMAEPHEMSSALLFLVSDASSYMTGANLVVDGGWTAW